MKHFNVKIPESRLDFVLDLFDRFDFVNYHEAIEHNQERRDHLKKIVQTNGSDSNRQSVMDALGRLNSIRESIHSVEKFQFRLPTHGLKKKDKLEHSFSEYIELKNYLETYFRVKIDELEFKDAGKKALSEMDKYMVNAIVKDGSQSRRIKILAGYSNLKLSKK